MSKKDCVHISFAKVKAPCPYCFTDFDDSDDRYVNAMNKVKRGYITRTCHTCANRVGLTYNMMSELVAFKLEPSFPL